MTTPGDRMQQSILERLNVEAPMLGLLTQAVIRDYSVDLDVGAVISAYGDTMLVEITGPGGKTVDTIQVPVDRLDTKRS